MKERLDLELYLRENPQAEKQADVIKEAMTALRKLRAVGVGGEGYTLAEPYGSQGSTSDPSKARNWHRFRPKLKSLLK